MQEWPSPRLERLFGVKLFFSLLHFLLRRFRTVPPPGHGARSSWPCRCAAPNHRRPRASQERASLSLFYRISRPLLHPYARAPNWASSLRLNFEFNVEAAGDVVGAESVLLKCGPSRQHLIALAKLVGEVTGRGLCCGNTIQPLVAGDVAYPAMIEAGSDFQIRQPCSSSWGRRAADASIFMPPVNPTRPSTTSSFR